MSEIDEPDRNLPENLTHSAMPCGVSAGQLHAIEQGETRCLPVYVRALTQDSGDGSVLKVSAKRPSSTCSPLLSANASRLAPLTLRGMVEKGINSDESAVGDAMGTTGRCGDGYCVGGYSQCAGG